MTADRDEWDRAARAMQDAVRPCVEAIQQWAEAMATDLRRAFGVETDDPRP